MNSILKDRPLIISSIILFACWISLCFLFYQTILFLFPSHIHAWTQSDRLAIAYGFLENNFNFFKPQLYNLETVGGITRVDFPINEYIVAIIMKITGSKSPAIFRTYTLIYSFIGLYFLFLLVYKYGNSIKKAFVVFIFVFTIPIFTYYQAGFIPTMTSLANVFIAFYFYIKYYQEGHNKSYYISIVFLTLASLMRTPFTIFLIVAFLQFSFEYLIYKKKDSSKIILYVISFGCIIFYYLYNNYLESVYGSAFLTSIMPANSLQDAFASSELIFDKWKYELATKYHYLIYFLIIIYFTVQYFTQKDKTIKIHSNIFYFILFSMIGTVIYYFLMQIQFDDHEYYFLDSILVPVIMLFVYALCRITFDFQMAKTSWILIILFAIATVYDSKGIQDYKYTDHVWNKPEITRKNFTDSNLFADSLNISKDSKVLVLGSYATNLPLLLLERKGYTCLDFKPDKIKKALQYPFDYMVVQNKDIHSQLLYAYPEIVHFFKPIGSNGKVTFYKKNPTDHSGIAYLTFIGTNPKNGIMEASVNDTTTWTWTNLTKRENSIFLKEGQEWGPTLNISREYVKVKDKDSVLVHLKMKGENLHHKKLILTSELKDSILNYQEVYLPYDNTGERLNNDCYFLFNFKSLYHPKAEIYKIYIHNEDKKPVTINRFNILFY